MRVSILTVFCSFFLSCFAWFDTAIAQSAKQKVSFDVEMAEDRSVVYTKRIETTPLNDAAVQNFSQHRLVINSNETLEILEAYTRKADGRVVPVDQSQIATQEGAVGPYVSLLDIKVKQIPFRDLGVGDSWVLSYKIVEKEHFLPGQFSWSQFAPPSSVDLELDFRLRVPAQVEMIHDEKDLAYSESRDGDWIVRHWTGRVFRPLPQEKNIANYTQFVPSLQFSTFKSYEDIGKAFFERAASKIAVTPAVQRLADEITAGKEGIRPQAEAIFDWVSKNLSYVAVFFGSGRFVPNDADTVLQRRFGDCKDHTTLMIALLAAKKIDAEFALINFQGNHELDKVPGVEAFNHVIVYIPQLNMYADPTTPTSTLGRLHNGLMDKPVLRISSTGVRLDRTPVGTADENTASVDIKITLDPKGKPQAVSVMEATGNEAQVLREFAHRAELNGPMNQMQAISKLLGLTGELTMSAPPSYDHSEPYRVTFTWKGDKPLKFSDSNWTGAWGLSLLPPEPSRLFGALEKEPRAYPAECRPGKVITKLSMEMPKGVFIRPIPEAHSEKTQVYSFKREWTFSGSTLKIRSELVSSVPSRVCSPELIKSIVSTREKGKNARNPSLRLLKLVKNPASAQIEGLMRRQGGSSFFGR